MHRALARRSYIFWREQDFPLLQRVFGIDVADMDHLLERDFGTPGASLAVGKPDVGTARPRHTFTLSDGAPDRMNDVVNVDGISLANYRKNPIVLLQHDGNRPIGRSNVGVTNGKLRGTVELAVGASADAEHAARLVAAGVLKAASIGFAPTEMKYIHERKGFDFHRSELLEWSLVSIPAAPGALIEPKALSRDQQRQRDCRERDLEIARLRS